MKGSAPNSWRTGFHSRPVKNPQPNSLIEMRELEYMTTIIEVTISSMTIALRKRMPRNTASPVLPVGEMARRQFHLRARAPNSSAGEGSFDCEVDITKSRIQDSEFRSQKKRKSVEEGCSHLF